MLASKTLESIKLFDFRNHVYQSFVFNSDKIIFWGSNGAGKTNILEAISVLSIGKSWRELSGQDLIYRPDSTQSSGSIPSAKIEIKQYDKNMYHTIIEPHKRTFFKNEKKIALKQHIGNIPILLFTPEMLSLIGGNKTDRLKFFDRFLCQFSPQYQYQLLRANRAHIQKIKTLKAIAQGYCDQNMLEPWNKILSETMPEILEQRQNLAERTTPILNEAFQKISGDLEPSSVEFEIPEDLKILEFRTKKSLSQTEILSFFETYEAKEILIQKNLISPTRGDFLFFLRNRKAVQTASRGEIRSLLLALLFAQKELFFEAKKSQPILCLDDVFSELDDDRQKHLERLCEGTQAFFTTTHEAHFKNFTKSVQAIKI